MLWLWQNPEDVRSCEHSPRAQVHLCALCGLKLATVAIPLMTELPFQKMYLVYSHSSSPSAVTPTLPLVTGYDLPATTDSDHALAIPVCELPVSTCGNAKIAEDVLNLTRLLVKHCRGEASSTSICLYKGRQTTEHAAASLLHYSAD